MRKTLVIMALVLALTIAGCSSGRYVPPPTANVPAPVDPQVAMQRQVSALSANMSSLQAQINRNNSQIAELSKLIDGLNAQIAALRKSIPSANTTGGLK